jgi:hypothetical protein
MNAIPDDNRGYEVWSARARKHLLGDSTEHRLVNVGLSRADAATVCEKSNRSEDIFSPVTYYYRWENEPTYCICVETPEGMFDEVINDTFEVAYNRDDAESLLKKYKAVHSRNNTGCYIEIMEMDESGCRECADTDGPFNTYQDYIEARDRARARTRTQSVTTAGENEDAIDEDMRADAEENATDDEHAACNCPGCSNNNQIVEAMVMSGQFEGLVLEYFQYLREGRVEAFAESINSPPARIEAAVIKYLSVGVGLVMRIRNSRTC